MKKEYIVLDSMVAIEEHYQQFKRELTQVLWDYELLDQTKLWESVQKGLVEAHTEEQKDVRKVKDT